MSGRGPTLTEGYCTFFEQCRPREHFPHSRFTKPFFIASPQSLEGCFFEHGFIVEAPCRAQKSKTNS